jgi:hypothetical protein
MVPNFIKKDKLLKDKHHKGLQGLKKQHKAQISQPSDGYISGSLDLDKALSVSIDQCGEPNASRWDYVLWHSPDDKHVLYFIEVHDASATSAVKEVVKKKTWLDGYLKKHTLSDVKAKKFVWLASGKNMPGKIMGSHSRTLSVHGIDYKGSHYAFA